MVLIVFACIVFIALCVIPAWYSRYIIGKYGQKAEYLAGTGGQLAKHFIDHYELPVTLERTEQGDHYDPIAKAVRLSELALDGQSLSAVAIASHEVGHAIQDHQNSAMLRLRTHCVRILPFLAMIAKISFYVAPIIAFWLPRLALFLFIAGFVLLLLRVFVHFITLPVEFDASFGKALPILQNGEYLHNEDYKKVRKILLACALTYVSAALLELVNVWSWLRFVRR